MEDVALEHARCTKSADDWKPTDDAGLADSCLETVALINSLQLRLCEKLLEVCVIALRLLCMSPVDDLVHVDIRVA